jgi:hypothetical protein
MIRKHLILVTALIVAGGCATTTAVRYWPLPYQFRDDPANARIVLTFTNDARKPVCLSPNNWRGNGILLNKGDEVSLEIGGRKFFLHAEQDYCAKCTLQVKPGETTTEAIPYRLFGVPPELVGEKKQLSFQPTAHECTGT